MPLRFTFHVLGAFLTQNGISFKPKWVLCLKGFQLLPRRWVVERTFAWLGRYRRLSKNYEELTQTREAMISAAMSHLRVRRLACQTQVVVA